MTRDEHLMTIAMEECAELAQRISKALRFGMGQVQPGQPFDNRERAIEEYAHLIAAMEMIGIPLAAVPEEAIDAKREKVEKFLRYSEKLCGTIRPESTS